MTLTVIRDDTWRAVRDDTRACITDHCTCATDNDTKGEA